MKLSTHFSIVMRGTGGGTGGGLIGVLADSVGRTALNFFFGLR